jgi:uracil-DNA glycosylase family 4
MGAEIVRGAEGTGVSGGAEVAMGPQGSGGAEVAMGPQGSGGAEVAMRPEAGIEATGHGGRNARLQALETLTAEIIECRRCPRLVAWREEVARVKVRRFRDEPYWGRPVPGFGDPDARILLIGLAPAAHGGNRTGRVFTGDASGDFLWAALHEVGLANRPTGRRAGDGLALTDAYVAAAVRCAPPANAPTTEERDACAPFLSRELAILDRVRVIVALGQCGWDAAFRAGAAQLDGRGAPTPSPRPRFGHGAEAQVGTFRVVASFHPSQQNTFTGRLTRPMLVDVLRRAIEVAGE